MDQSRVVLDTSADAQAQQVAHWRSMSPKERFDLVAALGRVLDDLGLPWALGGSLASSLVGEPRSTVDIDVAVLFADASTVVVADLPARIRAEVDSPDR